MAATREIGPMMAKFREVLLGRKHMNPLRFPHVVATRDWDTVRLKINFELADLIFIVLL